MNKFAIITSFLGETRNRYMLYQGNRSLPEKFEAASRIKGADGLELCYPADFEKPDELTELLQRYPFGIAGINFRSRRSGKWWRGSFTSEKAEERREVLDDLRRAMDYAAELGCNRITTSPLNDGADTLFEVDYVRAYDYATEVFAAACAHDRDIRICIADIELLSIKIRLLIASVEKAKEMGIDWWQGDPQLSSKASAMAEESARLRERLERVEARLAG